MTTFHYVPPTTPKSTEKLEDTIQKMNKLSEHSKVGDDNVYTNITSAPPSTMKKVKQESQVKHINADSLNTALANAMNEDK